MAQSSSNPSSFSTPSTSAQVITGTAITFTVPPGVTRIKATAAVRISNTTNFLTTNLEIRRNNTIIATGIGRNLSGGSSAYSDTIPMQALDTVTPGQSVTYDLRMYTSGIAGETQVNGIGGASLIVEAVG